MKKKHLFILIVSGILLIGFGIKSLRWLYYKDNTEINSTVDFVKVSADKIKNPRSDTYYYLRRTTFETIRTGVFPFLSIEKRFIDDGLWAKNKDSEMSALLKTQECLVNN